MFSSLILNANNAQLVADFLDSLPDEIKKHIVEYNPEHRKAMNKVFDQLIRYVFCPYYFSSVEEDVLETTQNIDHINQELMQNQTCYLCNGAKESSVFLKQLKIGFWIENGQANMSDDVNYCGECYGDICNWDRTKYVKHYVINGGRNNIHPYGSSDYLSKNDTIETIIDSFNIIQYELDKYEKRMPYGVYEIECDNLENEKKYLVSIFKRTRKIGYNFDN